MKTVARFVLALMLAIVGVYSLGAQTRALVTGIGIFACPQGISIFVTEDRLDLPAPQVDWATTNISPNIGARARLVGVLPDPNVPGGRARQFIYWDEVSLPAGAQGQVIARGQQNESYATFTVAGACPPLGSVRGVAFEDLNRNGARDANEPTITTASWKLTAGGDWYVCGTAGDDATFGPTVKPGTYTMIPVAQPGWRATTPPRVAVVKQLGFAALGNDIGFTRDPSSPGDRCGFGAPAVTPAPIGLPTPAMPDVATTWQALRATGLVFCTVSAPRLPAEVVECSGVVYARFHGTSRWYRHEYSDAELAAWAARIRASGAREVWAYFNNDHQGSAWRNAQGFRQLLTAP